MNLDGTKTKRSFSKEFALFEMSSFLSYFTVTFLDSVQNSENRRVLLVLKTSTKLSIEDFKSLYSALKCSLHFSFFQVFLHI